MKSFILPILAGISLSFSTLPIAESAYASELIVVASIQDNELSLTKQQVKSLFMGSSVGYDLKVATLPPNHLARVAFNTKVIGLTEARIQSYWAQMRFSGRKTEPVKFNSEAELINYLSANKGVVTYLPATTKLPDNVRVIFTL